MALRSTDTSNRDISDTIRVYSSIIERATNLEKERNENEEDIIEEKKELLEDEKEISSEKLVEQKEEGSRFDKFGQNLSEGFNKVLPKGVQIAGQGATGLFDYTSTKTEKEIGLKRAEVEAEAGFATMALGKGAGDVVRISNAVKEIKLLMQRSVEAQTKQTLISTYKGAVEAGIISVKDATALAGQSVDEIKKSKKRGEQFVEQAAILAGGETSKTIEGVEKTIEKLAGLINNFSIGNLLGLYENIK